MEPALQRPLCWPWLQEPCLLHTQLPRQHRQRNCVARQSQRCLRCLSHLRLLCPRRRPRPRLRQRRFTRGCLGAPRPSPLHFTRGLRLAAGPRWIRPRRPCLLAPARACFRARRLVHMARRPNRQSELCHWTEGVRFVRSLASCEIATKSLPESERNLQPARCARTSTTACGLWSWPSQPSRQQPGPGPLRRFRRRHMCPAHKPGAPRQAQPPIRYGSSPQRSSRRPLCLSHQLSMLAGPAWQTMTRPMAAGGSVG